jgi:hypothetical protein
MVAIGMIETGQLHQLLRLVVQRAANCLCTLINFRKTDVFYVQLRDNMIKMKDNVRCTFKVQTQIRRFFKC